MAKKEEAKTKVSRFIHEDEPEIEGETTPQIHPIQPLYSVGPSAPLADRRAAQATTERDRLELRKKAQK